MTTKRLVPEYTISENVNEVFSTKFSPDGRLLAAGCSDGVIRVYNALNGKLAYELQRSGVASGDGMPVTGLKFRPPGSSKVKNVLLAVNADGSISHWHVTSGKCLHTMKDNDNQLFCLDYRQDGTLFATAGKDYAVRIYDEATKTLMSEMSGGNGTSTPGHSNRVFSLKFNPTDPNILISGGWDNTVQIWDIRVEHAVRSIFGPHICGDAVDIHGNTIITGSYRAKEQLELWDYGSGNRIECIPWNQSSGSGGNTTMLYCAEFSPERAELIAAGGAGNNEAKVFDRTAGNELVGTVSGLSRGVFTVDFDAAGERLAVAGGDCAIRVLSIENKAGDSGAVLTPRGDSQRETKQSHESKHHEGKE